MSGMITKLAALADDLDRRGFEQLADAVDGVLKQAQTQPEMVIDPGKMVQFLPANEPLAGEEPGVVTSIEQQFVDLRDGMSQELDGIRDAVVRMVSKYDELIRGTESEINKLNIIERGPHKQKSQKLEAAIGQFNKKIEDAIDALKKAFESYLKNGEEKDKDE